MADLKVNITANLSQFKAAMQDFKREASAATGQVHAGFSTLSDIAKQATIAIAGVTAAIGAVVKTAANAGDELMKMSKRTGVAVEFLSEMKHVLDLNGSSLSEFEVGLKLLSRRMQDARDGAGEGAEMFQRLGVAVVDQAGELRDLQAVFLDLVSAINRLPTDTEKSAMALALFGRSGTMLLPTIKEGAEGINRLRQEAHELGITWNNEDAKAAEEFNDNLQRMKAALTGVKNEIAKALFPQLIAWLNEMIVAAKGFISKRLPEYLKQLREALPGIAEKLVEIAKGFRDIVYWIKDHVDLIILIGELVIAFKAMQAIVAAGQIVNGLIGIATAIKGIGIAAAFTPAGLAVVGVAAAITGIVLALKSLRTEADTHYLQETSGQFKGLSIEAAAAKGNIEAMAQILERAGESDIAEKWRKQIALTADEIVRFQQVATAAGIQLSNFGGKLEISGESQARPPAKKTQPPFVSTAGIERKIQRDFSKALGTENFSQQIRLTLDGVKKEYDSFDERVQDKFANITEKHKALALTIRETFDINSTIKPVPEAIESVTLQGTELWGAMLQQWGEENKQFVQDFANCMSQVANIGRTLSDMQIQNINYEADKRVKSVNQWSKAAIERIRKMYKEGVISAQEAADMTAVIEAKKETEIQEIRDKAADDARKVRQKMKPILIAEAIANTAAAIMQVAASGIGTFWMKAAQMALMAAAGAAQVAAIRAQKFAAGGLVPGRVFVDYTPVGRDTVPALLTPGEAVVRREVVQRVGAETIDRFARTGELPLSTINITINAIDTQSFERFLATNGREPLLNFIGRYKNRGAI